MSSQTKSELSQRVCSCGHTREEHYEEQPYDCSLCDDNTCHGFEYAPKSEKPVSHTKGPWRIEKRVSKDYRNDCVIGPKDHTVIADCGVDAGCGDLTHEEASANCLLVAAAPEMLQVLQDSLIFIDYLCEISTLKNQSVRMMGGYQNIENAIRKAKGDL